MAGLFLASFGEEGLWLWGISKISFWCKCFQIQPLKEVGYKRGLQKGPLVSSGGKPVLGCGRSDLMLWMPNTPLRDTYLSTGASVRDLNPLARPCILNQADSSWLLLHAQGREPYVKLPSQGSCSHCSHNFPVMKC